MNKQSLPPRYAKLFKHGGSQAVRLPKEFRMPGTEVTIRPMGRGVLIEPVSFEYEQWLKRIDALMDGDFMQDGRDQQHMPDDEPDHLFSK